MSRGGRGGGRGGRGGVSGRGKIGGIDMTWDHDPELDKMVQKEPTGAFPDIRIPISKHANRIEKLSISRYRALRSRVHEGPLYTILGTSTSSVKSAKSQPFIMDPFEGMRSYSQKFQRQRLKIPKLDTRPFVMHFFPEELRKTLDPRYSSDAEVRGGLTKERSRGKGLQIFRNTGTSRLEELDAIEAGDAVRREENLEDEKLEKDPDDDDDGVEDEMDDDFDEGTSDEDDYNAEAYFDTGEADYGDDGDGGGGEDYYD